MALSAELLRRLPPSLVAVALLTLVAAANPAVAANNYLWTDDTGKSWSRETPPDDPDQPYCIIEANGFKTCFDGAERLAAPAPDPSVLEEEKRQQRQEQLKRMRYPTLDAIDQGRDEQLRQLDFERETVLRNQESQQRLLFEQIQDAADRQRAGLAVPPQQLDAMEVTRRNLDDNKATLERIDTRADDIRREFDALEDQFRTLDEGQATP